MEPGVVPKVSVVTVYLDGENFLAEAMASVAAQSFADWEYILVDDGSTDGGPELARRFASRHRHVHCLAFPDGRNHGVAAARALGADAARGEYLLFLDHDDVLAPDALSAMVATLDSHPRAGAVFAGVRFWAYDPTLGECDAVQHFRRYGEGPLWGRVMLADLIWSDDHHPANCSTLFRRKDYLAARGAEAPYPGMYEETAVLFSLLTRRDVVLLDRPVASYRMHAGSMCHRAKAAGTLSDTAGSIDRERFLRWAGENVALGLPERLLLWLTLARYRRQRRALTPFPAG
jgi:glycosyltransferase involved in cell wall biosynthesis